MKLPGLFTLAPLWVAASLAAQQPDAEELARQAAAVKLLRSVASNIQKNRDGTVRFVRLSKAVVSDEHLVHLKAFSNIDYLAVVTPTVSDAGLESIANLTNLDTLFLSNSGLTNEGMVHLQKLGNLERLYLEETAIDDDGLRALANLRSLKTLSLKGTRITDRGLEQLADLANLEVLCLGETAVTDDGLGSLAGLNKLKSLWLDNTAVVGTGLSSFRNLKELERLDLSGCALDGQAMLASQLPGSLKAIAAFEVDLDEKSRTAIERKFSKARFVWSPSQQRSALQRFLAGEPLRLNPAEPPAVEGAPPAPEPGFQGKAPDFQRQVIPLLGRLGCNGRSCHGSFQGRGGFKLSMFGYDFTADYQALRQRIDLEFPEDSLILLKPTLQEDHKGGKRFEQGGWEYHLLKRWIESKPEAPPEKPRKIEHLEVVPDEIVFSSDTEPVQLRATAVWSDGLREDVTRLTRFQSNDDAVAEVTPRGLVLSKGAGDTYVISYYDNCVFSTQVLKPVSARLNDRYPPVETPTDIDRLVTRKLAKLGIVPSPLASDEEFLRRVTLDLIGTLPTEAQVRSFISDSRPDKRSRKIDQLLSTPAYVEWWTVLLSDLTGSNAQYLGTTDMNQPAAIQWNSWIRRRLQDNVGWDRIAAGIVLAESRRPGQSYGSYVVQQSSYLNRKDPQDYTALANPMHYYWFRSNNQTTTDRALSFGYVFLGVRLQCAQCHKHPFDQWSKQDFEKFSQFFARIKAGAAPDAIGPQAELKAKLGVPVKLDTAALRRQMYLRVAAEGLPIPWNEIWIDSPPSTPQIAKLLGGGEINLSDYRDPREPLLAWLVAKDNPYFSRAFVNRIWAHYFGIGIVDPPDDFNLANPPSNKQLLDWLADEFVEHDYNIKWLHRAITNSRTYQLSWRTNSTNRNDTRNFSHAPIRRLPAEVTIDAIVRATFSDKLAAAFESDMSGRKIGQHPKSIQTRGIDYSLLVFGKPLRSTNCDCERQMQPTLLQSLYVKNDGELLQWIDRKDGWLAELSVAVSKDAAAFSDPTPFIEQAYLRTLSRLPSAGELDIARQHMAEAEDCIDGMRDLVWVLLNTKEFLTNH